jgi:hypothetical protein
MERGELSPNEKLALETKEVATPIRTEAASNEDNSSGIKSFVAQDEEKMKEENAPDGDEKVLEWREGPHKVVERRPGPGQEVRPEVTVTFLPVLIRSVQVVVEVINNAYAPSETERASSSFHRLEESLRHKLQRHTNDHRHALHKAGKNLECAEDSIRKEVGAVEQNVEHMVSPQTSHEEEDEGWTSDPSENEPVASASTSANCTIRSESPKPKSSSKGLVTPRRGRRHNSIRKRMLRRGHPSTQKLPEDPAVIEDSDVEAESDRGRSQPAITKADGGFGQWSAARRSRIDAIRRIDVRREESPARSIRFADEVGDDDNRSGITTPQIPTSPRRASSDDEGSSKNKVTFDLDGI